MNTASKPNLLRRGALSAGLAAALLAGCVVAPVGPYPGEVVAGEAPPPPRYEVVPVAPALGWIWIGGFWNWSGGRHVWVPGYWHAPRPGYRWAPYRWEPVARGGWRLGGGRWER